MPFAALGVMDIVPISAFQRSSPIGRHPTDVRNRTFAAQRWTVSLVELRQTGRSEAVTGGAMDRVVERKRIDRRIVYGGAAAAVLLLVLTFWLFAPRANSLTVARDRLSIGTAQSGTFDDYLPLRARVTPLVTVYLDAVEGGRVEKKLVEDGAQVMQGQLLAVLSNAELQLSTLEKQAEVEQQLNNMRSQELALTQTRNTNLRDLNQAETDLAKMRRQYDLQRAAGRPRVRIVENVQRHQGRPQLISSSVFKF